LLALRGKLRKLAVDRTQVLREAAERFLGRVDLRAQRLGLTIRCCVHAEERTRCIDVTSRT
jgi:hypothetical protein